MKKTFVIIFIIFAIVLAMITINIKAKQDDKKALNQINSEYEKYLGQTITGADVASIIYKAIDNNDNYKIAKDEKGMYISDNKYCIKIELNMITIDKTYQMEQFYNANMIEFVKNFNIVKFKCDKIEYHNDTGRVSKVVFTQLEE